jgi:hypothetical protein
MGTEAPSKEAQDAFDKAVDDATHDAIGHFHFLGLPEGDQLSDLMAELNDAISGVMKEWL